MGTVIFYVFFLHCRSCLMRWWDFLTPSVLQEQDSLEEWRRVMDTPKGLAIATVVLQQDKKCNPGTELVN